MKLETFFEKFEQFAEAPNAVAKMRELVLQLAVQGKLVEQSPDDGTATDYIERSINERNRLVKEKRIRNSQSITPVSEFNTAGSLPKNWAWTTLAEISVINPRNDVEDDALATFIPMPGIPQNYRGPLGGEIRSWGEIKKSFTHFADGDIALAKITPCFQNGKSAVFRGLKNGIGAGTTELHVARPVGGPVLPEYVWIFLKSPLFIAEGIPAMTGSAGQKRVPTGYFALKPFPLPPLAEQKRIVAKVDELMALCDRLETQQQERDTRRAILSRASLARFADAPTPVNLNHLFHPSYAITPADLRKTILTLAIQGKLVPQDANDEPASVLLSRIIANNPRLCDSFKEPTARLEADEVSLDIPEPWLAVALGRVMKVTSSKRIFESEYSESGVPFFRSKEIGDLSRGEDIKTTLYISVERYLELRQHADFPKPGDLLLTSVGTIGNTWIVDDREFYFKDGNITQIIQTDGVEMRYVQHYISSPLFTDAVERIVAGTAYSALTIVKIKGMILPLPPLAEQRRIVTKVDQLIALVNKLETQIATSRATATKLMEAVVAELTAQE